MSNLIEAAPEEPGNGTGGSNRAFIAIALGLASLLVIGLLLIFGYVAGSRLGFFGTRALATPDASVFVSGPAGTATAVALAGATAASVGPLPPVAATSAAATTAAGGTRVPGAAAATQDVATPTPTRVVGGAVSTPTTALNTPAPGAVAATKTPGGAAASGLADATATPSGPGGGSSLPGTGVELDIVVMGILMVILLVLARGFRMALHS